MDWLRADGKPFVARIKSNAQKLTTDAHYLQLSLHLAAKWLFSRQICTSLDRSNIMTLAQRQCRTAAKAYNIRHHP
ncbi:hypothetical protein [Symbiopectobacterium purcellii]|uniref:Transposase n=1 Tax=Symbiopectobacterium purcellii TaxID=2871826 RepID=A0ABX9AJX6_9ENTR|nr:hypothetical protein [Symbiopectobacterium purcellii]QZN94356.1 hypothetical protein K6K13_13465 [Symbiopectobacterium purcellii]